MIWLRRVPRRYRVRRLTWRRLVVVWFPRRRRRCRRLWKDPWVRIPRRSFRSITRVVPALRLPWLCRCRLVPLFPRVPRITFVVTRFTRVVIIGGVRLRTSRLCRLRRRLVARRFIWRRGTRVMRVPVRRLPLIRQFRRLR